MCTSEAGSKLPSTRGKRERAITSLSDLKEMEICIDGIIFDLTNFDHPGGDSVKMFCGNDCTVFYKMIHPYHPLGLRLQKLKRVGKVKGYASDYTFDSEFAIEMKREVGKIVQSKSFATVGWWFRSAVYLSLILSLSLLWIVQGTRTPFLAIALGISFALLGLNVQHDANHGAVSTRPWLNALLGFGSDFIGKSKWIWCQQHWTHHAFTNEAGKDPDISAAEPILLFHDYPSGHPKRKWYHPLQLLLFFPVMSTYWATAVTDTDIIHLQHSGVANKGMNFRNEFHRRRRAWAVLSRVLHVTLLFGPPFYHQGLSGTVFRDILLVGVSGGILLGCLFSLSHNFEGVEREHVKGSGSTPVCWYKRQVETSSTYGGFVSGALTGGLNFQIEHHLFPRMSSAWYPFIAPTVRRVCAKHGVRYTYFPWIHQNILSFARTLHFTGRGDKDTVNSLPSVSTFKNGHLGGKEAAMTTTAISKQTAAEKESPLSRSFEYESPSSSQEDTSLEMDSSISESSSQE